MGFAGQVFAARVAVGLAMPSPKAFSQAGQMIGSFAGNMYKRLNKENMNAAGQAVKNSQERLDTARENLKKHVAKQNQFLEKSSAGALNKLRAAYKGLGKASVTAASAMGAMKAVAPPKVHGKLFDNIAEDISDAKKYEQLMVNFMNLHEEERADIIKGAKLRKNALKDQINSEAKRKELGEERVAVIRESMAELDVEIGHYKHYDDERRKADARYGKDHKSLADGVIDAEKEMTEAQEDHTNAIVAQDKAFGALQQAGSRMVVELKQNFIEALRESISMLTAFYYKLNQNTQELIEFERELMNANSVFRVTNDELFNVGDTVVQFGQEFGLSMQNGATGLYQLASAGLTAAESMEVLTETLKLSMAVQGDHNTISKLVTQTLFGFDMEMNQAAIVTDKFAYAIQKSLIEYQDLASAVKFALPFFTTTGQSIDQLLGALQILTNRALEAGIAGRGLRQGVAELAESIGDASANFRQFGVEVTDNEGNMLQLTEIAANFSKVLGEGVINDTELLTSLIQDLNVRGATAFVHLVQASDEFTQAVEETAGAGGELDEMIKIQNQSMSAQIQILQNNIGMMFLFRDAAYEDTEYLNAFHEAVVMTVQDMRNLLVVQLQDGTYELTQFGKSIQSLAISGIQELRGMMQNVIPILQDFVKLSAFGLELFKAYLIPIKTVIAALGVLGPNVIKLVVGWNLLNKVIPISTMLTWAYTTSTIAGQYATDKLLLAKMAEAGATPSFLASGMAIVSLRKLQTMWTNRRTAAEWSAYLVDKIKAKLMPFIIAQQDAYWIRVQGVSRAEFIGNQIKHMSLMQMIREYLWRAKLLIQKKIEHAMTLVELELKLIWAILTGKQVTVTLAHNVSVEKSIVYKIYSNALLMRNNMLKWLNNKYSKLELLLTEMKTKAYWKELFVKIQGNQADKVSFRTRLANNWARTQEIFAIIKKTFWQALDNIGQALSNALASIGGAIMWTLSIPGKIWETLVTAANSIAKWWNNLAEEAGTVVRLKAIAFMLIKNTVMVIATVIVIAQTVAQWAWNIALYANPVVLVVAGVILLVVGLVALAIRMRENVDVMHVFNMVMRHTLDMLLFFPKLIWNAFTGMGSAVMDVMEGPLFKLFLFIRNVFRFLLYHVKLVGAWFKEKLIDPLIDGFMWIFDVVNKYLIQPILGFFRFIHDGLSAMRNPLLGIANLLMTKLVNPLTDGVKKLVGWVRDIVNGLREAAGNIPIVGGLFKAEGGYVQAMAEGGTPRGKHPYIVGEKGPELFMPQVPGRIIPNKDLNSQRVNNMIASYDSPHAGAENAYRRASGDNIVVNSLEVKQANLKSSRVGIDTFGGYI